MRASKILRGMTHYPSGGSRYRGVIWDVGLQIVIGMGDALVCLNSHMAQNEGYSVLLLIDPMTYVGTYMCKYYRDTAFFDNENPVTYSI